MNYDQITGILRAVVPAILAYCVAKGWITQSSVGDITAAIIAVGSAVWSVKRNTLASKVAAVVADPTVNNVSVSSAATPAVKAAAQG